MAVMAAPILTAVVKVAHQVAGQAILPAAALIHIVMVVIRALAQASVAMSLVILGQIVISCYGR